MNPEKFPNKNIENQSEIPKISAEESALNEYEKKINNKLNEAYEIKQQLVTLREQHKNKSKEKNVGEESAFDKRNPTEVALRQRVREMISDAIHLEEIYGIDVEIPDFNSLLDEEGLNELEGPIRQKHMEIAERKKAA